MSLTLCRPCWKSPVSKSRRHGTASRFPQRPAAASCPRLRKMYRLLETVYGGCTKGIAPFASETGSWWPRRILTGNFMTSGQTAPSNAISPRKCQPRCGNSPPCGRSKRMNSPRWQKRTWPTNRETFDHWLVFGKDVRRGKTVFVAVVEKVFLTRQLHLGPALWANTDDPRGANAFDD